MSNDGEKASGYSLMNQKHRETTILLVVFAMVLYMIGAAVIDEAAPLELTAQDEAQIQECLKQEALKVGPFACQGSSYDFRERVEAFDKKHPDFRSDYDLRLQARGLTSNSHERLKACAAATRQMAGEVVATPVAGEVGKLCQEFPESNIRAAIELSRKWDEQLKHPDTQAAERANRALAASSK